MTTKPQHTPAPWAIRKGPYGSLLAGPAELRHPGRASPDLETKLAQRAADAALIGAAPDMLAALEKAADILHLANTPQGVSPAGIADAIAIARAAIARATTPAA